MAKASKAMRRIANRERALKISLEKVLNSQLQKVFNNFMRRFLSQFKSTGIILNAHVLTHSLQTILTTAYKRTAAAFTENFTIGRKQDEDQQSQDAIAAFIALTVPAQVALIINTTNAQLEAQIRKIAADDLATGKPFDLNQLGTDAFQQYNQILSSRVPLIGMFQIQNAAEAAKQQIATTQDGVRFKTWVAILDTKTRRSHAFADGQERAINDPFTVMGQQLKHPGDLSLGATLENVMNCRCSAIYS